VTRYRVVVTFGPWIRGDVFESSDPFHALLADRGKVLEVADGASAGGWEGTDGDDAEVRTQG
jgi:hypothetical protein